MKEYYKYSNTNRKMTINYNNKLQSHKDKFEQKKPIQKHTLHMIPFI